MIRALISAALLASAAPAAAQTIAITGATVALGDGSEPIQNGVVVIRNGRIVGAGHDVPIPHTAQMIDARGKWVTPGIVAGFSRLGLSDVDLGTHEEEGAGGSLDTAGSADDSTNNGLIAVLSFGEGWHNNHHAHPTSARHGLKWYEFDMNWLAIRLFMLLGWAKKVRVHKIEPDVLPSNVNP